MTRERNSRANASRGFTLLETMAAITLLMIAIIAPMSLATQSLSAAYYARDQITGFYLAQEGIEVVRSVRDGNILEIAQGQSGVNLFNGICPTQAQCESGYTFTVDSTVDPSQAIQACPETDGTPECPPLQTDGTIYGQNYSEQTGWTDTTYTRSVTAKLNPDNPDELRITSTVTWTQGNYQIHSFTLNEDLYDWVPQ